MSLSVSVSFMKVQRISWRDRTHCSHVAKSTCSSRDYGTNSKGEFHILRSFDSIASLRHCRGIAVIACNSFTYAVTITSVVVDHAISLRTERWPRPWKAREVSSRLWIHWPHMLVLYGQWGRVVMWIASRFQRLPSSKLTNSPIQAELKAEPLYTARPPIATHILIL